MAETAQTPDADTNSPTAYDADAMLTETSLLIDWFWPAIHGKPAPEVLRQEYFSLWRPHLEQAAEADPGLVIRDYHSPNLM